MTTLIQTLKEETKTLKIQFIEMTKEWAKNDFYKYENITFNEIEKKFGILTKGYKGIEFYEPTNKSEAEASKKIKLKSIGLDAYLLETKKKAEIHYNNSIEKLASRIEKKGLNENNLKAKTGHVGVNIETTLTDGNKKVSAFTIIAGGAVQRPHYRYLIK